MPSMPGSRAAPSEPPVAPGASPRRWNKHAISAALTAVVTALAVYFVLRSLDLSKIVPALHGLRPATLVLVVLCMVLNMVLALIRFERTLAAFGAKIPMRMAAHAFAYSSVASQFLLNIVGQSLTRAMVLRAARVPMSLTVVATYVERLIAFGVLGLAAVVAALTLFGSLGFNMQEGGAYLLSLAVVLLAVLAIAGLPAVIRVIARDALRAAALTAARLVPVLILTVLVFAAMFAAYFVLALDFAPGVGFGKLAAAIIVVMFAAGVPISWAGWGLREFGAVYALSAIGVPNEAAVIVAVTIGTVGLLVTLGAGLLAGLDRWRRPLAPAATSALPTEGLPGADAMLYWAIGILTACLICFQLRVPVALGPLTVNVADPLAITAFFFAGYLALREDFLQFYPRPVLWAIAALASALLLGAAVAWLGPGLTQWALLNRLFGFLILLGYAATPGLVMLAAGDRGRLALADAFVASALTICALELVAYLVHIYLVPLPIDIFGLQFRVTGQLEGFAQNPNAFAFQLLMALGVLIAMRPTQCRRANWPLVGALCLLAVVLIGRSRAGVLAAAVAIALAVVAPSIKRMTRTHIALALAGCAIVLALFIAFQAHLQDLVVWINAHWRSNTEGSDALRWQTTSEGLRLWLRHPLFGEGLGSFLLERQRARLDELVIHSVPIWFLAEMGLVGFAAYAGFVATLAAWGYGRPSPDLVRGLLSIVTVFVVMGLFHDIFYQRTFWFGIGLLVTIPTLRERPENG